MNTRTEPDRPGQDEKASLLGALRATDPSVRLRAAMSLGAIGGADVQVVEALIECCAVEPDFFVRDMLTWALCRQPADVTVPLLLAELDSGAEQAKSQALHTLSKIGDGRAWPRVSTMLHDRANEVARAAWRAAVVLNPAVPNPAVPNPAARHPTDSRTGATEVYSLAADLAAELGRRDVESRRSLSRALVSLGGECRAVVEQALSAADGSVRVHAAATIALFDDPDSAFDESVEQARRVAAGGTDAHR